MLQGVQAWGLHFLDIEAPPAIEVAISENPAKGSTHAAVRYAWLHRELTARTASTRGLVPDVSRRTHPFKVAWPPRLDV